MRVLRIVRIVIVLAIIGAIVMVVVGFVSARPDLDRAKRDVTRAWTTLAADLTTRYRALGLAAGAARPVTGPPHDVAIDVDAALARWSDAKSQGVGARVQAANAVEGAATRLITTVRASPRIGNSTAARAAIDAFAADRSAAQSGLAFDRAVLAYEKERRGPLRRLVARVLGDDSIPAFAPGAP